MKKITLLLCSILIAAGTFAQTWKYTANTSSMTATITGLEEGTSYSGALNIPATIAYGVNTLNVTNIDASAFKNYTGITSVIIPEGVTFIGNEAFYNCQSMTTATIPSTVTTLGRGSFQKCTSLHIVNYNVRNMTGPYYGPNGKSPTSSYYEFYNPPFYNDTSLSILNIGDSVIDIPKYLCYNNTKLTTLNFGTGVKTIGEYAFASCKLTNGITLPSSLTTINNNAFGGCLELPSVIIPEGVTYIGNEAFYNCQSMTTATIPSTVATLGRGSFQKCTSLHTVNYNVRNMTGPYYGPNGNSPTSSYYEFYNPPFYNDTSLSILNIGDSVIDIPKYLCYNNTKLTTLNFGTGAKSIGEYAFASCKLTNGITLPSSLTTIGNNAFQYCKFESITIPRLVTSISSYAFANNTALTTVNCEPLVAPTINNSYTFSGCSALTTINIPCGYSFPSYQIKFSSYTSKLHYDRPAYTVSVKSDNTQLGSAVMTKEPNCDAYIAILEATPEYGYHFTRWSDDVTRNPYEVELSKDTSLTAYFEINRYTFKLQVSEVARGNVSQVSGVYDHGSEISFEATPNYGYHFTQWSDGVKNSARTLTILSDSTITAVFVPNVYTINCGTSAFGVTTGAGSYDYLSEITLSATPNYGYKFSRWSDGATVNPRIVLVERDSLITAEYAPIDYQVVVKTADKKMGTVQPSSAEYPYLSEVELTATPKYGYHFTGWSNGSALNPYKITVQQDTVLTANFAVNTYTVALQQSSFGTATGAGTFDYLTDVEIIAIPNYGYKFQQWSDGVIDNPRLLTIESDTTLSMVFEPQKFTLRTQSNDDEMGSVSPSIGKYNYLSEVEITAIPEYGYHFEQWSDGRIANPRKVTIEKDTLFEAEFAVNTYTISVTSSAMGKITGAGEFDYLSECTLRATANYGYQFVSWKDGVTTNPRKITVTQDSIFSAIYQPIKFTIEAYSANNKQGSVTPETQEVAYQSIATITANAAHGYKFKQWDDNNTDNPRSITVTEDMTFIASFERDEFEVTIADSEFGSATGAGKYLYQSNATIEATAIYGYEFKQWSDGNTDNPRTIKVEDNISLSMEFVPAQFTVLTQPDDAEHGQTTPAEFSGDYLSTTTITAIANQGFHFTQWNDGNTDAERVITINKDMTFIASFERNEYEVTIAASEFGSATGAGKYLFEDEATLEATANYGYEFKQWSDGNTDNPRTIKVEDNISLSMEFALVQFTILTQPDDAEHGQTTPAEFIGDYLSTTTITATANHGYHFTQWNDGNTDVERLITLTKDMTFIASFERNEYEVTIAASEFGSATGAGKYLFEDEATLEATANYGYEFKQWSDGNTDNPRTIKVEDNISLSMEFALVQFTILTQPDDAEHGQTTPAEFIGDYLSTTTITATANHGYHFTQWNDGNTDVERVITINKDMTFIASFERDEYEVTIAASEFGSATGAGKYLFEDEATLEATANYGYEFKQWSDGNTDNPRTIKVEDNISLSMEFAPVQFTILTQPDDAEHGQTTPAEFTGDYLSTTTITATANHGYHFTQWNDGNTDAERVITLTKDMTFIASFERNEYEVTIAASEFGSATGAGKYLFEDEATLEATANYGYEFKQWSDGNTDNPRTIKVDDNISLSMEFALVQFTILTQPDDAEHGQTTPAEFTGDYLSTTTITATAHHGYHFTQWSDGNTDAEREVVIAGDVTYTASFAPNVYTISMLVEPQGFGYTVAPAFGNYQENIEISAVPFDNYLFTSWSDGNTDNPRVITLTQDTTFTAIFEIATSGTCGDDNELAWTYDQDLQTLTISGIGTLNSNYTYGAQAPTEAKTLVIGDGITSIGEKAFYGFSSLKTLTLGKDISTYGEKAFAGCSNLTSIYNYRPRPSKLGSSVFEDTDYFECTLYVLAGSVDMYKSAGSDWKVFYNIESIGATPATTDDEEINITVSNNSADVTWPAIENAATYELEIRDKEGNLICTLIFNTQGQLQSIAFAAPSRSQSTAQTVGFTFTVTGLDSGSQYSYALDAKDANGEVIYHKSGSFTTSGGIATSVDNASYNIKPIKIIRDDQLFILLDGKTYTVHGQEVR